MYNFDPAINYGPNDAGVSAVSILLVTVGILLGFLLIGYLYGLIANLINGTDKNGSERD